MVLRDRNHPSIFVWSLCNEGGWSLSPPRATHAVGDCSPQHCSMQQDPYGGFVASAFKKAIFDVDTTRAITANSEDRDGDTLTKVVDVNSFSYNYAE